MARLGDRATRGGATPHRACARRAARPQRRAIGRLTMSPAKRPRPAAHSPATSSAEALRGAKLSRRWRLRSPVRRKSMQSVAGSAGHALPATGLPAGHHRPVEFHGERPPSGALRGGRDRVELCQRQQPVRDPGAEALLQQRPPTPFRVRPRPRTARRRGAHPPSAYAWPVGIPAVRWRSAGHPCPGRPGARGWPRRRVAKRMHGGAR